jgi:hypothetical protein
MTRRGDLRPTFSGSSRECMGRPSPTSTRPPPQRSRRWGPRGRDLDAGILFTRSATEGLNLVAYVLGQDNLGPGGVVCVIALTPGAVTRKGAAGSKEVLPRKGADGGRHRYRRARRARAPQGRPRCGRSSRADGSGGGQVCGAFLADECSKMSRGAIVHARPTARPHLRSEVVPATSLQGERERGCFARLRSACLLEPPRPDLVLSLHSRDGPARRAQRKPTSTYAVLRRGSSRQIGP